MTPIVGEEDRNGLLLTNKERLQLNRLRSTTAPLEYIGKNAGKSTKSKTFGRWDKRDKTAIIVKLKSEKYVFKILIKLKFNIIYNDDNYS